MRRSDRRRRTSALLGGALLLAAIAAGAAETKTAPAFGAKGYLYARYVYIGSSSPSTVLSGLRLTGSFSLSALDGKVTLKYRSHHWIDFSKTDGTVLESRFENRHIVQAVALEARDLIVPGLGLGLGRFFPELDYASCPVIDGGAASYSTGAFSVSAATGRMVDLWNGKEDGSDLFVGAQVKYRTARLSVSAGYNSASYFGILKKELPAGLRYQATEDLWLEAYQSYDLESSSLARAGLSLSWRAEAATLSVMASQWRNPFDQLYLVDK